MFQHENYIKKYHKEEKMQLPDRLEVKVEVEVFLLI